MNRRAFLSASVGVLGASGVGATGATRPTTRDVVGPGVQHEATIHSPPSQLRPAVPVWHDVREWGVEGRGFEDTGEYFERLPGRAKGVVREAVWNLSRHTSGMVVGFETDATEVHVRYALLNQELAMPHMPASGVSGLDLYAKTQSGWRWVATHQPRAERGEFILAQGLEPGWRAYRLYLPLYNGVKSLDVGVRQWFKFEPVKPRKVGAILFYGTSITQGGCASRPGMSFTSILGRRLDRPVLNFGFSGNGTTEVEVARFLAELEPAVFVLDTVANTAAGQLKERAEAVVRLWKKERPGAAVLMLDGRAYASGGLTPRTAETVREKSAAFRAAYEAIVAAGLQGVHYRGGEDLIGADGEGTVDGSHPTDLGMMRYAEAVEPVLRRVFGG